MYIEPYLIVHCFSLRTTPFQEVSKEGGPAVFTKKSNLPSVTKSFHRHMVNVSIHVIYIVATTVGYIAS